MILVVRSEVLSVELLVVFLVAVVNKRWLSKDYESLRSVDKESFFMSNRKSPKKSGVWTHWHRKPGRRHSES